MSRVGEGWFGRGAWVEWKVQRDKKRGILWWPCVQVERVVPQPIGSDSRWRRGIGNNVRSSNARVSSYVTMLQKFELSRQTSGSRCATETVGFGAVFRLHVC